MPNIASARNGSCPCGRASFDVTDSPLVRAYCHCLVCQSFNDADRADIVAFRERDVVLHDESSTEFKVYRQPPLLRRGACRACGRPSIERLSIPGLPKITIVPAVNLGDGYRTIEPGLHIFYHRRVADADDDLPRYSGYLRSQIGLSVALIKAMSSGGRRRTRTG